MYPADCVDACMEAAGSRSRATPKGIHPIGWLSLLGIE